MAISETGAVLGVTKVVALMGGFQTATLTGAITLDGTYANHLKIDPGGAARNVTLPAETGRSGVFYHIVNAADAAENLVIKNAAADTICTINQNESAIVSCDGSAWTLFAIIAIALA